MTLSRTFALALVAATALSVPMAAMADGPSWWDPLNLTGSAKPKAAARKPAAKKDSSWAKLPGFGTDSAKKPATRKASEPSTLTKVNKSTKKFFAGAKDALTPWDNKKPASKQPTGYGTGGGQKSLARGNKEEDKGNILTSFWKDKDPEPKRPKTVPDFISGERP